MSITQTQIDAFARFLDTCSAALPMRLPPKTVSLSNTTPGNAMARAAVSPGMA